MEEAKKVKVKELKPESLTTKSGVPQRSVPGPLLFLIYIKDLPNIVSFRVALPSADDLKVIFLGNDKSLTKSQIDLNNLHCWSIQNHLLFNYKKCTFNEFEVGKRVRLQPPPFSC